VTIVFASATQDIVLDALRTELLEEEEYGIGAGVSIMGYRIGMLISGALALYLVDDVQHAVNSHAFQVRLSWRSVYLLMASLMSIGVIAVLLSPEPEIKFENDLEEKHLSIGLQDRLFAPFREFFQRPSAVSLLSFITVYKLSTMMATSLTVTFLMSKGYLKSEIAMVSKVYGLIATIAGTLAGGSLMTRISLKKALWIFGIIQSLAGLSFLTLTNFPKNRELLILVLITENFMIGLGAAALSGFMMKICSKQFTGTQFALLSSVTAISRVVLVSQAGRIVNAIGWNYFFIFSVFLALPGLILLTQFDKWIASSSSEIHQHVSLHSKLDRISVFLLVTGLVLIALEPLLSALLTAKNIFPSLSPLIAPTGAVLFGISLLVAMIKRT
jgi:PAT family beta-lactamase induction signal transducer AmpG